MATPPLTPELVLHAYAAGVFPMADNRDSHEIHWIDPLARGIFPLNGFRISRSLRRRVRQVPFKVTFDRDFAGVVAACAARDETWINADIARTYGALHHAGHAHSIELWDGEALAGGVYGVSIGAAFFGESMFSARRDASKIALAYLIDRLRVGGYALFDTQFLTAHLASLGAIEVSRARYHDLLRHALTAQAAFHCADAIDDPSPDQVLQRMTQTS